MKTSFRLTVLVYLMLSTNGSLASEADFYKSLELARADLVAKGLSKQYIEDIELLAYNLFGNESCGEEYRSRSDVNRTYEVLLERDQIPKTVLITNALKLQKIWESEALNNDAFAVKMCKTFTQTK